MASMRPRASRARKAAGLLGEIEQHRPGLEHGDRLAAAGRRAIHERGNTVVR